MEDLRIIYLNNYVGKLKDKLDNNIKITIKSFLKRCGLKYYNGHYQLCKYFKEPIYNNNIELDTLNIKSYDEVDCKVNSINNEDDCECFNELALEKYLTDICYNIIDNENNNKLIHKKIYGSYINLYLNKLYFKILSMINNKIDYDNKLEYDYNKGLINLSNHVLNHIIKYGTYRYIDIYNKPHLELCYTYKDACFCILEEDSLNKIIITLKEYCDFCDYSKRLIQYKNNKLTSTIGYGLDLIKYIYTTKNDFNFNDINIILEYCKINDDAVNINMDKDDINQYSIEQYINKYILNSEKYKIINNYNNNNIYCC